LTGLLHLELDDVGGWREGTLRMPVEGGEGVEGVEG